jgi:hypothetical protein
MPSEHSSREHTGLDASMRRCHGGRWDSSEGVSAGRTTASWRDSGIGTDESDTGSTRPGVFGKEVVVSPPSEPCRPGEHTAHRDLAFASVVQALDEVARCAQRMSPIGRERALGRSCRSHEQAGTVATAPSVCTLSTGIGAVHPRPPRTMRAVGGPSAYGAPPGLDDLARGEAAIWHRDDGSTLHAFILGCRCDSARAPV